MVSSTKFLEMGDLDLVELGVARFLDLYVVFSVAISVTVIQLLHLWTIGMI